MLSLTLFYRKGLPFLNEHGLFVISIYTNYFTLSERKKLEERVAELNIKNITFTGTLSKNEVLNALNKVDLLFFSLIEDPVFEKTIPSKLFDYLLNNKPIITSIKGEGRKILEELGCALFFDPNESESLANALREFKDNKENYEKASLNNREYVIENYNREEIFLDFLEQLNGVTK